MIVSLYLRHFKIYKGINFIPLSIGHTFASIIGENGVGKSSILEALDFAMNKRDHFDWPVNNEAKAEGGIKGANIPFVAPVFLIHKDRLKKSRKDDKDFYDKALKLSEFLWKTTYKSKAKGLDDFYRYRDIISKSHNPEDYLLLLIGRKHYENGIYFGSFHTVLDFLTQGSSKAKEDEIQEYFEGFYDYIISHYTYLHIPVETDPHNYTKLETSEMQKLMDKNIQSEIQKAITQKTVDQINSDLDTFVREIEKTLNNYEYKGHHKNRLTMKDMVNKIIESYFSIKVLNRMTNSGRRVPVYDLSSGEKRQALIDVAYSFLKRNNERDNQIIIAIDEPEASLHISACYSQFEKLLELANLNHQIIISTHWYGYLPILSKGAATSVQKDPDNNISVDFFDLYNYREQITQARKAVKGPLPYDISLKSYTDLVQSIVFSLMTETPYNWIICEGLSEKIYFEFLFQDEIDKKNLRILPVGGFKEVKKIYENIVSPVNDPDYNVNGKVVCLIDTDGETVKIDYKKNRNLKFYRLLNEDSSKTKLVDVHSSKATPPTEIEDCLSPSIYLKTLEYFAPYDSDIQEIISSCPRIENADNSANCLDLRKTDAEKLKGFFDKDLGNNKLLFAMKYVEIAGKEDADSLEWIEKLRKEFA